jgi:hypothetical protein
MLGPTASFVFTHVSVSGRLCARRCIPSRPTCSRTLWWRPFSPSGDHYVGFSLKQVFFVSGSGLVPHSSGPVYPDPDWEFRSVCTVGSGLDPDSVGHRLTVCVFGSGIWIYQGKIDPLGKKESEEVSCFVETRVLFEGLRVSPVTWKTFMET